MVKTYNLSVWFGSEQSEEYSRSHYNISRTAVKYYLDWYRQNPEFFTYVVYNC